MIEVYDCITCINDNHREDLDYLKMMHSLASIHDVVEHAIPKAYLYISYRLDEADLIAFMNRTGWDPRVRYDEIITQCQAWGEDYVTSRINLAEYIEYFKRELEEYEENIEYENGQRGADHA